MVKITFEKIDLLTVEELTKLMNVQYKDDIAQIISNKIKRYIIVSNNKVYLFNKEYVFYIDKGLYDNYADEFKNHIIRYINDSVRQLETDNKMIYENCIKKLTSLQDLLTQKNILNLVKSDLTNDTLFFNDNSHEKKIHFLNGYFDFKENKFKVRIYDKDFITYCIPRLYEEEKIKQEHLQKIKECIEKIFPKEDDRNKIFEFIGKALLGEITKEQISMFFLGIGSNGKSFIMQLLKLCLCDYVIELRGDVFRTDNPKQDKILNTLNNKEFACFIWINELDEKKINEILFKEFVEGKIKTTLLFKDGLNEILYKALSVITSNNFPNIKIDGGIKRRIKAYTFKSRFVSDDEKQLIDESKNIYKKDINLYDTIQNDDILKNAFFKYIKQYAVEFLQGKKYDDTENFKNTYESIINVNDKTGNFFQNFLIKTTNDKDRLNAFEIKENLMKLINNIYQIKTFLMI
jgi:phage/plasmid-associated DNA primase